MTFSVIEAILSIPHHIFGRPGNRNPFLIAIGYSSEKESTTCNQKLSKKMKKVNEAIEIQRRATSERIEMQRREASERLEMQRREEAERVARVLARIERGSPRRHGNG